MKKYVSSFIYTIITMIGSLLPLIAIYLLNIVYNNKYLSLINITGLGEVLIICIPILISVILSLYEKKSDRGFMNTPGAIFVTSLILLIIAIIIYVGGNSSKSPEEQTKTYLSYISLFYLFITTISFFFSKLNEINSDETFINQRLNDQNKLGHKFRENTQHE